VIQVRSFVFLMLFVVVCSFLLPPTEQVGCISIQPYVKSYLQHFIIWYLDLQTNFKFLYFIKVISKRF